MNRHQTKIAREKYCRNPFWWEIIRKQRQSRLNEGLNMQKNFNQTNTGQPNPIATYGKQQRASRFFASFPGFFGFSGFLAFAAFQYHNPWFLFLFCLFLLFKEFKHWNPKLKYLGALGIVGLIAGPLGVAGTIVV